MIPKLLGGELISAQGYSLGQITNRVLYRMYVPDEQGETLKFCAFAIMEFGGLFDKIWINDGSIGRVHEVPLDKIRVLPCDKDNNHILTVKDFPIYDLLK
jgi:hypothetical protein